MTPSGVPSRSIGTAEHRRDTGRSSRSRAAYTRDRLGHRGHGRFCRSSAARADDRHSRPGAIGFGRLYELPAVSAGSVVGGPAVVKKFTVEMTSEASRLAKPAAISTSVVEHRLQIECRAADHLEHVGGGGLLLQRFAQLVEQARVLDGDDGLVGEVASPARSACR